MAPIYLDYNATTPVDPIVLAAMMPFLTTLHGNPSSSHSFGAEPKAALANAREQVAQLLGCDAEEIVFTGGASESNNFAVKGLAYKLQNNGNHMITTLIEHPSILEPCHFLERNGFEVTYVGVDRFGVVNPDHVRDAIRSDTILISIMHANNEVGTIQPIAEITQIARQHGIPFHTDAAQTVGKIGCTVKDLGVDLLSVAGHKIYAPKGVGALYIRRGIELEPLLHGAGQESGKRAGTENVAFAVGLGKACQVASEDFVRYREEVGA